MDHKFLLRIIGFQRRQRTNHLSQCRQRTNHLISYAKALKKAQCESVETTIRKQRLLFAGAVQRTNSERQTRRVMFGTTAGGENPGPGRPEKNWAYCLAADLRVFRATEGPTESVPLVFGVETVVWPTAAKKGGKWYRGVVEAVECFMTKSHMDERRTASYDTQQKTPRLMTRNGERGKRRAAVLILLSTNLEVKWYILWQGAGLTNKCNLSCYSPRVQAVLFGFRRFVRGGVGSTAVAVTLDTLADESWKKMADGVAWSPFPLCGRDGKI